MSNLLGVQPHVLRYWETEFPSIRPQKSRTNQRLYRPRDIQQLARVKSLLYEEGYTIAGARKRLATLRKEATRPTPPETPPPPVVDADVNSGLRSAESERIRISALPDTPPEPSPGQRAELDRLESRCRELELALSTSQADKAALKARLRKGLESIRDLARNRKVQDDGA